jgi:plasmid stability protein
LQEDCLVATITIRNLDDEAKRRLRLRAAEHGRSMEAEAREILGAALLATEPKPDLAQTIRARVARVGGFDLEQPPRAPLREPPSFE